MAFYDERRYIKGRPAEISPSGKWLETSEPVPADQLPPPVRATFEAILEEGRTPEDEIDLELLVLDRDDPKGAMLSPEIEFQQVLGGAVDIWQMGIHERTWPMNPTGHSFYCRSDGIYLGYHES